MASIQFRLIELMSKKNMTVADIERKSDIPVTSLTSILNGTSKNPTIKTLRGVAKALDITLEQLLSDDPNIFEGLNEHQIRIYQKCCDVLIDSIIEKGYKFSVDKISSLIKELYDYSSDINSDINSINIDNRFVDWLLKKNKHLSSEL